MNIIGIARRIADNQRFQHFILGVIVVGAIVIGVETSPSLTARHNALVPLPCCLTPGPFAMVARLARLLRITRVVSVFPELRLIIGTMVRSIPSMGHVIVLLSVLLCVYAVLGFHFFREASPVHWGSLGAALLTLFQMLTLEGWVEIQGAVLTAHSWAWIYFSSFIFVAVFVVVNLFIAIVINNLESVKHEQQVDADRASAHHELLTMIETVRERLAELEDRLRATPPTRREQGS